MDHAEELKEAIDKLPGDDVLVIQFLDTRGPDGLVRKYRVMMVDGNLYPLHLAISRHWLVHYFRADNDASPRHQAEEADFLEHPWEVLGPTATPALRRVAQVLALDYGGIDFTLDSEGRLVVFEANAAMALYSPGSNEVKPHRKNAVEAVTAAVRRMLATA